MRDICGANYRPLNPYIPQDSPNLLICSALLRLTAAGPLQSESLEWPVVLNVMSCKMGVRIYVIFES